MEIFASFLFSGQTAFSVWYPFKFDAQYVCLLHCVPAVVLCSSCYTVFQLFQLLHCVPAVTLCSVCYTVFHLLQCLSCYIVFQLLHCVPAVALSLCSSCYTVCSCYTVFQLLCYFSCALTHNTVNDLHTCT